MPRVYSMASVGPVFAGRDPFAVDASQGLNSGLSKQLPILSTLMAGRPDPMDLSQSQSTPMAPPVNSPQDDRPSDGPAGADLQASLNGSALPVGAAAAAQQPKVVQTAFIHKLYM